MESFDVLLLLHGYITYQVKAYWGAMTALCLSRILLIIQFCSHKAPPITFLEITEV